jgi:hypothetical protein
MIESIIKTKEEVRDFVKTLEDGCVVKFNGVTINELGKITCVRSGVIYDVENNQIGTFSFNGRINRFESSIDFGRAHAGHIADIIGMMNDINDSAYETVESLSVDPER